MGQYPTSGGEISYQFIRSEGGVIKYSRYLVTVKLYKDCLDPNSTLPNSINVIAYQKFSQTGYAEQLKQTFTLTDFFLSSQNQNACVNPPYPLCYYVGVYRAEMVIKESVHDYIISYQENWRKDDDFFNVNTHNGFKKSGGVMGYTFATTILGADATNHVVYYSSSPVFNKEYPLILCAGNPFRFDFSANDPDGDSLSYAFAPAYQGFDWSPTGVGEMPPFNKLVYRYGCTAAFPISSSTTIDPRTGMITGTGPLYPGKYVVCVEVKKYRNGVLIAIHRKESVFLFYNCTWARAQLDSSYRNCNGTDIHFTNYSTGNIRNYFWDFGDPTTNADTSNLPEPTYHYPAPGTYTAKLFLNRGTPDCKDSAICTVIVDSGMKASFTLQRSLAACNQAIYDFTNTSTQSTNPVNLVNWDFGENTTNLDVSTLPNPSYLYPTDGQKTIRLIIGNSIGCRDTAYRNVNIFSSLLHAPNDTILCYLDTIRLDANTHFAGTYSWSPNYNISNTTIADPLVSPDVSTNYQVSFVDTTGCVATDQVFVDVRTTVNLAIVNNDTLICKGDTVLLKTLHDGIKIQWRPGVDSIDLFSAFAHPTASTQYIITASVGSCIAVDTFNVKVVPLPTVSITRDSLVCIGAPVYLSASGGVYYHWTPVNAFTDPSVPDPIIHPIHSGTYTVEVRDTLGCPKPSFASVTISTFRGLFAKAKPDTLVVIAEPVQLIGSGGKYFEWSPAVSLDNPTIANPVATPLTDTRYVLRVSNDSGCIDFDSIYIRVFKDPDIYVPTAFSPNRDGLNDVFRVFPVSFYLETLVIYDRWGNKVFETSDANKGWDGSIHQQMGTSASYVWIVKGKNKKTGKPILKRGVVTLVH